MTPCSVCRRPCWPMHVIDAGQTLPDGTRAPVDIAFCSTRCLADRWGQTREETTP